MESRRSQGARSARRTCFCACDDSRPVCRKQGPRSGDEEVGSEGRVVVVEGAGSHRRGAGEEEGDHGNDDRRGHRRDHRRGSGADETRVVEGNGARHLEILCRDGDEEGVVSRRGEGRGGAVEGHDEAEDPGELG